MLKQKLITYGIVSWVLFSAMNLLLSSKLVALGHHFEMTAVIRSIIISLVLYALPMIWGALGHNSGYYLLAMVIVIYSFGLFNGIVTVLTSSTAVIGIKAGVTFANFLVIVFNGYWMVLALRYRHWLDNKRDNEKLAEIKKLQEKRKQNKQSR
ncbi:hypothetical protein IWT140_01089 [Secundilactobacillus pentosiphilus]|uniref:Integral membrane protein n=1 Tax=Secundilactobacillus pentosiphilus TaxID=1714682 RepID=A0A1Z5IP16_9LACO|nr:hypothetical protein [Secundilactobacillus pentosiphilus]GAX03485.1 hypothetical protein IWT140_01089 [Secundilactobacillus pentosiphilus]GAX06065.1 hypothetical protein IWT25_01390 [Secundilactobacillus pentosiphilus]